MVERARRLRMGLAHSSPGASGDIARPNYVGPSGNGLVERMNAGESPRNQGRSVKAAPVRFQKAVSRSKENAAVERREVNALRHWACAARRIDVTPRLSALRSPHVCEGELPLVGEGMEIPALPAPCEKQGRRSFGQEAPFARKELRQQADFPLKSVHPEDIPAWNAALRWSKSYPKIKPAA